MLLANKFYDLVIGVDFHNTTSPPFNPVHPFIGLTFDISAFIPFIGATTYVNGVPYGNSGTTGMLGTKAHIPLVGSFALQPMIAHESTNFFGSMNTYVEGMRLSGAGWMVMACNDVGVPLSMQPGTKGKKPKMSLFAPTAVTIPIPKGSPVMVGGPYVPDITAALKSMAMGYGIGCLGRTIKAGKVSKNIGLSSSKVPASESSTRKFRRNMSERRKALLRDANDPNSGLSTITRKEILGSDGKKVPKGYEVAHKIPLYTRTTEQGKRKLDKARSMETIKKSIHRDQHKICGSDYHRFGPANKPKNPKS